MNNFYRLICIIFTFSTSLLVSSCGLEPWSVQPLSSEKLGTIENDVIYCNIDGLYLKMDIYYPHVASGLVPAILYLHGGGWYMGDKADILGFNELATRGYLVASINYRLAPQSTFPAQIEDVKCAVRYLRSNATRLGLDTDHIGVLGYSAGAHLAALLGVTDSTAGFDGSSGWSKQSSRVQAVVDIAGPSDLTIFNTDAIHEEWIENLMGKSKCNQDALKLASPISYVSNNSAPFLIIHGDQV